MNAGTDLVSLLSAAAACCLLPWAGAALHASDLLEPGAKPELVLATAEGTVAR